MITDNMIVGASLPDGLFGARYPDTFFGGKAMDFLHYFADQRFVEKSDEDVVMIGHNDITVELNIAPIAKADVEIEEILGEIIIQKKLPPPVDAAAEKVSMIRKVYAGQTAVEHFVYLIWQE